MPHLTARVPEAQLAGREPALITALTDAVAEVYGEWVRDMVVVHLDGKQVTARLIASLTDAVASVLGEQARSGTIVELVANPEGRTGIGGAVAE